MARMKMHLAVVATLIIALALVVGYLAPVQVALPTIASDGEMTPVEVVEQVGPAVVTVINEQQVSGTVTGDTEMVPAGSGSGFIIDDQGHIITNNHVVENGNEFQVIYADGTKLDATLIGADPLSDLAVVQVNGDLPGSVPFGDSRELQPAQDVLAMGSPLGAFANTVTDGIVSGLGRSLSSQPGSAVYTNLIQHNAQINPGNSGGPLFNLAGEVIGVNTIGIPLAEQGVPAQGLFFAIPSNTVKKITDQLINNGKVVYPFLGVESLTPIDPKTAAQNDLPVDHGVYVAKVTPGSPAAEAGLQHGDIIVEIDGEPIDQNHPLEEFLFEHQPGDTVELTVQRGQEQQKLEVELSERPS
jgi:2-alkenal reductase